MFNQFMDYVQKYHENLAKENLENLENLSIRAINYIQDINSKTAIKCYIFSSVRPRYIDATGCRAAKCPAGLRMFQNFSPGGLIFSLDQWIGLRENLQETIDFPIKYGSFL